MSQPEPLADQRYFHLHGLKAVAPEQLNDALKAAIDELEVALYGPSRTELTDAEIAMLERAGVDLDERPDAADPMLDYATEFAAIRATSLTPAALARTLGVTPVRVRQMIRERSLYAIRIEGRLYVPVYQVADQRLVPNIGRVNRGDCRPRPGVGAALDHPGRSGPGRPDATRLAELRARRQGRAEGRAGGLTRHA